MQLKGLWKWKVEKHEKIEVKNAGQASAVKS